MLSKLFAHIKLGSRIGLFIGAALVSIVYFIFGHSIELNTLSLPKWLVYSISGMLLFLSTLTVVSLFNNGYKISKRNSYAGLIMVLTWGLIPNVFSLEISFSIFLFTRLYLGLFQVAENSHTGSIPYLINVTIIAYLAFLLSPLGWLFLILILLNNLLYANVSVREIVVPIYIFAFCLGLTYAVSLLLEHPEYLSEVWSQRLPNVISTDLYFTYKFTYLILASIFLLSLTRYFSSIGKSSVLKRKALLVLVIQFFLFLSASFLFASYTPHILGIAMVVDSILFANYIQDLRKRWLQELFLWILIILNGFNILHVF